MSGALNFDEDDKSRLLENALDAVVGCDASERVIYWNRHAEVIFGWSKTEAIGRRMGDLIVPERLRAAHRAGMRRFLETGHSRIQNQRIEVPAIAKGGREFTVELTVTSMREPDGGHRFYSFIRDISDAVSSRAAAEQIRLLQHRFSRSAGAIDLGVWYCDLPLDTMVWSPETCGHFFIPPSSHVDRALFLSRLHPDDRTRTQEAIDRAFAGEASYDIVYRTVNPADASQIKYIRSVGWIDRDDAGIPRRFDGVTRDVSREHAHRVELERARDEAERANRLKSSFLANMSHEIRTPLGAMLGFAELLRAQNLDQRQRARYLDVLIKNGEALSTLIDEILDLSKIEAGRMEFASEVFDLADLVAEVVDLLTARAAAADTRLILTQKSSGITFVRTDRGRARQILINLIGNALKFTTGGTVEVILHPRSNEGLVQIDVTDTGIGVAPSHVDQIFETFEQADNTISRRFGGTGLGLALSRSLARRLDGDVELLTSEVGRGSTFRFTLRDQRASSADDPAEPTPTRARIGGESLRGTRVLLADDSPDNRFLIGEILRREGVIVTAVDDGREACHRAAHDAFDLVLMDVQMPGMDGYTAARAIRSNPGAPPIVAVTAHAFLEDRRQSARAGCVHHLTKPIRTDELIRAVQTYRRRDISTSPPVRTAPNSSRPRLPKSPF